jgi:hypothetical protein
MYRLLSKALERSIPSLAAISKNLSGATLDNRNDGGIDNLLSLLMSIWLQGGVYAGLFGLR